MSRDLSRYFHLKSVCTVNGFNLSLSRHQPVVMATLTWYDWCTCSKPLLRLWCHGCRGDGRHGEKLDQRAYTTPLSHSLQGRRQVSGTGTTRYPFSVGSCVCLVAACVVSLHPVLTPARKTTSGSWCCCHGEDKRLFCGRTNFMELSLSVGVVVTVKTNTFSVAAPTLWNSPYQLVLLSR